MLKWRRSASNAIAPDLRARQETSTRA
jgi:hypothetical protein